MSEINHQYDPQQMTERIKTYGRGAGFDLIAITSASPPTHAAHFQNWLAEGKHGSMAWLARNADKRVEPELVLPGARSLIMVGLNYGDPDRQTSPAALLTGRVARYARGTDYHSIMWEMLEQFEEFLGREFGVRSLSYVDTGPILERDLAARAGLGWQGKSTMLISRHMGTYFFIGEVLTTLKLPADRPETDHCGSCTRCIQACPTGAITGPHQMDARRCISYLTIENKGPIPEELRPLMGDRIYGCDDCLEVCPWNRFARTSHIAKFAGNEWTTRPKLLALLALNDQDFKRLFHDSPILRIKRPRLLRNVCVALGNVGDTSCLPALKLAAQDPDALIAEHARWAIEQIDLRSQR